MVATAVHACAGPNLLRANLVIGRDSSIPNICFTWALRTHVSMLIGKGTHIETVDAKSAEASSCPQVKVDYAT